MARFLSLAVLCGACASAAADSMFGGGGPCPQPRLKPAQLADGALDSALFAADLNLEADFAALGAAGAQVAVSYRNEIVYERAFGYADVEAQTESTVDTLYRVGSISKVFTTLLAVALRDAGVWSLDDKVTKWLPDFYLQDAPESADISLRALMGQMSGLPREVPGACSWVDDCYNMTTAEVVDALHSVGMNFDPWEQASYSNLGFALLGQLAALATDSTYDEALAKYVLGPMALVSSGDGDASADPRAAVGYSGGQPDAWMDIGWCAPAGNLYSTATDLLTMAAALQGSGRGLAPASARELRKSASYVFEDGWTRFDFPFEAATVAGRDVVTKSGNINGFGSFFGFVPALHLSFAVLVNSDADASVMGFPMLQVLVPALENAVAAAQPLPRLPPFAESLVGSWESDSGIQIDVALEGGRLLVTGQDSSASLLDWSGSGGQFNVRALEADPTQTCFTVSLSAAEGAAVAIDTDASPMTLEIRGLYYGTVFYQGGAVGQARPRNVLRLG